MSEDWKDNEKRAAKLFGGARNTSRTGNFSLSQPDVINSGDFIVEAKQRKKLPKWATEILRQAQSYDSKKTPVGYLHEKYKKDAIVIMWASDFNDWFGDIIRESVKHHSRVD